MSVANKELDSARISVLSVTGNIRKTSEEQRNASNIKKIAATSNEVEKTIEVVTQNMSSVVGGTIDSTKDLVHINELAVGIKQAMETARQISSSNARGVQEIASTGEGACYSVR